MSFPISPSNGAQTTVNGITYTYRASTRSWLRVQAGLSSIEILGNLTAGNLFINNTGDVSANIGAFYTYANTTFTTLDANVGTLFLGNSSTNANLGAFQEYANANIGLASLNFDAFRAYANTKIGSNADGNLVTNGNVISNLYYSSGGTSRFALSDIGLVTIDVASQQYKFGASGIESNPGIFGGSYGGNKLSLNNETALISNRYDTVTIQTGTDGSAQNTWTFGNSALTAPGRITALGNIIANSGVSSTSNVTGALVVTGGVGVSGNVYADTLYTTTGIRWAGNGVAFSSGGGGGASTLDDLTDVIISSPATNQVLKYNGSSWINGTITGGGGGGGITYTADIAPPVSPNVADQWYNTTSDTLYEYLDNGVSQYWVDVQTSIIAANASTSLTDAIQANIGQYQTWANAKIGSNTNSNLVVAATTASASNTTGALVVGGGVGVTGNINLVYNPVSATGAAIQLTGKDTRGGIGWFDFLTATNTTSGATNPNKSIRLNSTGGLEIINSAYTTTILSLSDAGAMNISGSYQVAGKQAVNGPAFRAYIDGAQTITSGSQQKVTFGTETFDTNSNFSSSRFTPTVEGYYQLNATVRIDGTASTGEVMIILYKNGGEYARGTNEQGTEQGVNFYSMQVSDLAYANGTGDYFEIYIQQTSGGNRNTTAGTTISYFSGVMVRGA